MLGSEEDAGFTRFIDVCLCVHACVAAIVHLFCRVNAQSRRRPCPPCCFFQQSLTLWRDIMHDMFRLWCLGEEDLLSESFAYKLVDTGQGKQRVQNSPQTFKAMQVRRCVWLAGTRLVLAHSLLGSVSCARQVVEPSAGIYALPPKKTDLLSLLVHLKSFADFVASPQEILFHAQHGVQSWVGSSVIHLGDHNVPNALMFIDKYTQVRLSTPCFASYQRSEARIRGGFQTATNGASFDLMEHRCDIGTVPVWFGFFAKSSRNSVSTAVLNLVARTKGTYRRGSATCRGGHVCFVCFCVKVT